MNATAGLVARRSSYRIRRALNQDLDALPAIELAAARMLVGYAPESVLTETTGRAELEASLRVGLLWVAVSDDGPVGFAHVLLLEPGGVHLEELDVHPDHGRQGNGRRLVAAVCDWAASAGMRFVTLSTFREPPWNAPFYRKLGFAALRELELSPAMRHLVVGEARRGLDPSRRVVMRRML
jgi:GNAT superfamily N-acetyltransferase